MTVEISLLIALFAASALAPVVLQLRALGPRIAALREELETADYVREVRFTIREVVVLRNDGKVVPLPVRRARLAVPTGPVLLNEAA